MLASRAQTPQLTLGCRSLPALLAQLMSLCTINFEDNLPTLDEAPRSVLATIRDSKRSGIRVLNIIHG
jgi:hypothetical protein